MKARLRNPQVTKGGCGITDRVRCCVMEVQSAALTLGFSDQQVYTRLVCTILGPGGLSGGQEQGYVRGKSYLLHSSSTKHNGE